MRQLKLGKSLVAAACGGLLAMSSAFAAPSFEDGIVAYKRGDYASALSVFRPLAEKGIARAQTILGLMYSYGEGVPVDMAEAASWYRLAAEQGYIVAQYNLGMLYLQGRGVERNTDEAAKWLEAAARGGHFRAKSELAKLDPAAHSRLPTVQPSALDAPPGEERTAASESGAAPASSAGAAQAMAAGAGREAADQPGAEAVSDDAAVPRSVVLTRSTRSAGITASALSKPSNGAVRETNRAPAADAGRETHGGGAGTRREVNGASRDAPRERIYRVQLAASQSENRIRRDWSSFQKRYPEVFGDLEGSIERAEIGADNTVWYRLRVGPFQTEARARELCLQIRERGIRSGCLPLRVKR